MLLFLLLFLLLLRPPPKSKSDPSRPWSFSERSPGPVTLVPERQLVPARDLLPWLAYLAPQLCDQHRARSSALALQSVRRERRRESVCVAGEDAWPESPDRNLTRPDRHKVCVCWRESLHRDKPMRE